MPALERTSPLEKRKPGVVGEIADDEIGRASDELFASIAAGGDCNRLSANRPRAAHVERSVADHPHLVSQEIAGEMRLRRAKGFRGDMVAVFMQVAEAAERKVLEETEVPQLELRAIAQVAGQ